MASELQAQGTSIERGPRALVGLGTLAARSLPTGAAEHLASFASPDSGEAVYISTPITTGPRLLAWLRQSNGGATPLGSREAVKSEVVKDNIAAVAPLRQRIQERLPDSRIIDPTAFDHAGWSQTDYHRFWVEVLRQFVDRVVVADGWQYSTGCLYEFTSAVGMSIPILDSQLRPLDPPRVTQLLRTAREELAAANLPLDAADVALRAADEWARLAMGRAAPADGLKDSRLYELSGEHNVAVFASFAAGEPVLRHYATRSGLAFDRAAPVEDVVAALLAESTDHSLNVRTFRKEESKSSPFLYGITSATVAAAKVRELASAGFYTIVNETIDVHDGGVSGVSVGGVVEFAPDATPRAVEGSGTAQMERVTAERLLSQVYGFTVRIPGSRDERFEFSIHPQRVGQKHAHICVWEAERISPIEMTAEVSWPNDFSALIGDKTFGLLVAHASDANVPLTTAVPRRLPPFAFGTATGSGERWIRTAPARQEPGYFTTSPRWQDPYELLAHEDPDKRVAAILAQDYVPAVFSGATVPLEGGQILVEGVAGNGDKFMLGSSAPVPLPDSVVAQVRAVCAALRARLGPVRIEWAYDGASVWVLQLHRAPELAPNTISPGDADNWLEYDPQSGLDALRRLISQASATNSGILVVRPVGVTSHVGDLLRKAGLPARFSR